MLKNFICKSKIISRILAIFLGGKEKEFVNKCISEFYEDSINQNKVGKISRDLAFSKLYYKISPREYFQYNFIDLSDEGRKKYIGNVERHELYTKIGNEETKKLLNDKYECYKKFEKYYKRDIIKIENDENFKEFVDFYNKHEKFIVKPIDLSMR
ncbi:MAG: hypothetical protein IKD76_01610 [Clostridia bacterium]|nr:hypothetical protein [Clostridia bacterium]